MSDNNNNNNDTIMIFIVVFNIVIVNRTSLFSTSNKSIQMMIIKMIKLSIICNLFHLIIFSSYFNKYNILCDDNQINHDNNENDNKNLNSIITFPNLTTLQCDLIIKKHSKIHGVGIYAGRNYKRGEVVERCISISIPNDKG
jgi:hypothetical protein